MHHSKNPTPNMASTYKILTTIAISIAVLTFALVILAVYLLFSDSHNPFLIDNTDYAPGYSESAFKAIRIGESEAAVRKAFGNPLREESVEPYFRWLYTPDADALDWFKRDGEDPFMCSFIMV